MHKQNRFEAFSEAFRAGLLAAVQAHPEQYVLPRGGTVEDNVLQHADRILVHIAEDPMGVNYNGGGFRRACKTLGIKPTRTAILAYLAGE
jgi:hypothetical protein